MKNKKTKIKGADLTQSMPADTTPDQNDYETKRHLDTIIEAHGIQQDPVKMKKVHALAGRHMDAIKGLETPPSVKSTDDLRAIRNKKFGTPSDGE